MDNIFTTFKPLLVTIMSVIMAYLAPVSSMVYVIFLLFLANCVAGIVSGMVVDKERFNVKKFFIVSWRRQYSLFW